MAKKRKRRKKKEPTEEERQMIDTIDFFESLLVNNSIDKARSYMINLIYALYNGYKVVPNYNITAMYKMVRDTRVELEQPIVFLNNESKRRLKLLFNCYDWTKTDISFLEDFCQNTLKYGQRIRKVDSEKSKQIPGEIQKLALQLIWGVGN